MLIKDTLFSQTRSQMESTELAGSRKAQTRHSPAPWLWKPLHRRPPCPSAQSCHTVPTLPGPGAHQSHWLGFTHIPDGMQLPRALCSHPGGCIPLGLFYLPAETQTIRLQPPAAGPVPPPGFLERGFARDQGTGDGSLWDPDGKTPPGGSCMLWD